MPFCIGWVENFDEITLTCTVKKIEANSCFSIFGKNLKIQNFLKIAKSTFLRYPMDRKFQQNNYFARLRPICDFPFWAKIRKFKMAAICGTGKIFWKLERLHFLDTLWVENFNEITLFCTVKANLWFSILGKNSKIQNGRHMWDRENFLKIGKTTFLRYPMGRKFQRNNSILHG